MSEYQYYEFQAIDRPVTEKEMAEIRSYSSRARITPTSFFNEYSWGDFKGDPDAWMEKYFDAFLYLANWGTHVLKLRLSARLLNADTARLYCAGENAWVREKNGKVILTFPSDDEGGGEWVEGEGELASIISVRAELARGDHRALYLGWLLNAQSGDLDDDEIEPPVPAGLHQLSASIESLADFLRIDTNLLPILVVVHPGEQSPGSFVRVRFTSLSRLHPPANKVIDEHAEMAERIVELVGLFVTAGEEHLVQGRCTGGSTANEFPDARFHRSEPRDEGCAGTVPDEPPRLQRGFDRVLDRIS
jgi:hypothetical protein